MSFGDKISRFVAGQFGLLAVATLLLITSTSLLPAVKVAITFPLMQK